MGRWGGGALNKKSTFSAQHESKVTSDIAKLFWPR